MTSRRVEIPRNFLEQWAKIASLILIPFLIALSGYRIDDTISRRAAKIEHIKIALGILQPQKDESPDQQRILKILAPWAIQLLDGEENVKLSGEQKAALMERKVQILGDYELHYT